MLEFEVAMDKPPVIKPPAKAKGRTVIVLSLAAILGGAVFYKFFIPHPPKDSELIQNFHANRAAYERLRDMLRADGQVIMVGSYGVATTNRGNTVSPEAANFPVERYDKYLVLLKQV